MLELSLLAQSFWAADLENTIVSVIKDKTGGEHILSRFTDATWDLSPYFHQSNVPESLKTMPWPTDLPSHLLEDVKRAFFAWLKHGKPGYDPAIARTVIISAINAGPFLRWLTACGVSSFDQLKPLHLSTYIRTCKEDEELAPLGVKGRLEVINLVWIFRESLARPIGFYPWGEQTFGGYCGIRSRRQATTSGGKTPVIPSDVQVKLFQYCERKLEEAHSLLARRDCGEIGATSREMLYLRDACLYLVSITSGMRNEEVIGIEVGAGRTEIKNGIEYNWVTSVEHKTGKGRVDYLVPAMTLRVLDIMERYSAPLRNGLELEQENLRRTVLTALDINERQVALKRLQQVEQDKSKVFLTVLLGKFSQIKALTISGSQVAFRKLAKVTGVSWKLSPHQCRRTYARNVVESRMGKKALIFVKWQFKHSSISMSQLYAANPTQDQALFADILEEYFDIKAELLFRWSDGEQPLSGGAGRKIVEMRATAVANREQLIVSTARQINIRATGHGWCIAQDSGCGGAGLYEQTRCVDCRNGVIDAEHLDTWRGIHQQLREMLDLNDLGPVANDRIRRDIEFAAKVMDDFGVPIEQELRNDR